LFVRSTRQVRLTDAGRILLDKAKAALDSIRDAREAVAAVRNLERGTLSIGAVQSLRAFLDLPSLIGRFHAEYPGVEVRLRQGSATELIERVRSGRLDLAFLPLGESPADIKSDMIACEALVVACAPNHPLAGASEVSLAILKDEPFIDFEPDWGTRKLVDQGFFGAGISRLSPSKSATSRRCLSWPEGGWELPFFPRLSQKLGSPRLE
jgi:DNA-binding transcriptional LysR family regulator